MNETTNTRRLNRPRAPLQTTIVLGKGAEFWSGLLLIVSCVASWGWVLSKVYVFMTMPLMSSPKLAELTLPW